MAPHRLRDHLGRLYAFSAIARSGSLTHAAKQLGLTQTALSHSLKALEEALGARLLVRRATGVTLTEPGKTLHEFTKRLFLDLEALELRLDHPSDPYAGKLRVGTHETIAIHLWPEFLRDLSAKYPSLHLSLVSGRVDALVDGVLNGDYDVIVTVEPLGQKHLEVVELYSGRLAFFAAPASFAHRYPALEKKALTLREANAIPLITDSHAHQEQHVSLSRMLVQQGLVGESSFELSSFEAAIRLAALGLGIAVLPERNAKEAVRSGRLREIRIDGVRPSGLRHKLCASYRKGNTSPLVSTLIKELQGAAAFARGPSR